ncbi:MAG: GNAT family N-acetyltransferase [Hadesarchaea archaeon]|nr:GNAT family N-acetyltransferase [Hadesarchaea archaeon]
MRIEKKNTDQGCKYMVWDNPGTRVIGRAILKEKPECTLIKDINIQRNLRGNGLGSKLLKKIFEDFENTKIVANVFEERVNWYQRHGFKTEDSKDQLVKVKKFT